MSPRAQPQVIPATLFGSFLEPIGHSTYGGLWADVVENPSLEEGLWSAGNIAAMLRERPELRRASELGLPLPWEPLDQRQGNRYLPVRGDAANSNQSLLVMALPGKTVGIRQRVYLSPQRQNTYNASLWVKHVRGNGNVSVSLRRHNQPDKILASAQVVADKPEWTKYEVRLSLKPNEVARLEPVDLVLALDDDARAQFDSVSLFPADAIDGMDPDEIQMARDLHSPIVRFGGNFTSAYDWHDGVGPTDKRVSVINPSWGIPEYNTFGTDEFLRFCELIHASPQIALNLGTGTPESDAEWVRYVNAHWGDHHGGLLWELGNELWGDFQIAYPGPERIAAVTLATSQAVRAADPRARLIATGGDEDSFHDWNARQLTNAPGTFNYLSTHFVVTDSTQLRGDADFRSMAALALPWGLAPRMHQIQQQAAAAGHKDVRVAFTEWLMISEQRSSPNFTNMGGALFAGGFLNMLMRNAGVLSISDMTGIMEFGGIWKKRGQVYGAPAYYVLREYAQAQPHTLLDVVSDGGTYTISHGITRLPEIADVPYLDCVASEPENASEVLLTCVNRHLTRAMEAEIDLGSLPVKGTAHIRTIHGSSILDENDEENPQRIAPVADQRPASRKLHYTFPNASVTVMHLPLQR
ncbi:alpha-L-arabinofuranosidase C-terminal domain-containing protein [Terriglobus aquaticus]|uniref:non-reducing end alpha-L-arabinofuranosidase n=1 Tax=Terriglobus aquaticus TaxID=940139 RepID=A0ABW9KKK9_9BACT|nr:alpha-L-arabinofuranosidase C-terminal domain-containing protein [Terriglobus aquaticus]